MVLNVSQVTELTKNFLYKKLGFIVGKTNAHHIAFFNLSLLVVALKVGWENKECGWKRMLTPVRLALGNADQVK